MGSEQDAKRVLIVEEDDRMRSVIRGIAQEEGYITEFVDNDLDAFKRLAWQPFDLIIIDGRTLGSERFHTIAGLRKLQPDAFVCFITDIGVRSVRPEPFGRGGTIFFKWPIDVRRLRKVLQEFVSQAHEHG
jgi:DNA-binding NtrC family response regulator